jgi:hypothetical protein
MPPLAQAIVTFLSAVLAGTVAADAIADASEISLGTAPSTDMPVSVA